MFTNVSLSASRSKCRYITEAHVIEGEDGILLKYGDNGVHFQLSVEGIPGVEVVTEIVV